MTVILPFEYNHEIKDADDETFYTIEEKEPAAI